MWKSLCESIWCRGYQYTGKGFHWQETPLSSCVLWNKATDAQTSECTLSRNTRRISNCLISIICGSLFTSWSLIGSCLLYSDSSQETHCWTVTHVCDTPSVLTCWPQLTRSLLRRMKWSLDGFPVLRWHADDSPFCPTQQSSSCWFFTFNQSAVLCIFPWFILLPDGE